MSIDTTRIQLGDEMAETKQVSFKFDKEQAQVLEDIKTMLHAKSQAEAIRKSLNLTSVLATATSKGYTIILRSPDETKEQELLII